MYLVSRLFAVLLPQQVLTFLIFFFLNIGVPDHDHEYIFRIMNTKQARCYVQCSLEFPTPSSTQDCTQLSQVNFVIKVLMQ